MGADRKARSEERRGRITLRKTTLADSDPGVVIRGEAAVSLAVRLTDESWALSGAAFPTYSRRDIPCRFVPRASG